MFRPADMLIDAYLVHLTERLQRIFPEASASARHGLERVARRALVHTARSDALYTNLEGTLHACEVLLCLLEGRQLARGDLSVRDWLQLIAAALCAHTGFVRGALPGDDGADLVADRSGTRFTLSHGMTDGCLQPVFRTRSQAFVHWHLHAEPEFDCERIIDLLEALDFPLPQGRRVPLSGEGGLLAASRIIAQAGDPRWRQRMPRYYRQLQEAGLTTATELTGPEEAARRFLDDVRRHLLPEMGALLDWLGYTVEGQLWLARLQGQLFAMDHPRPRNEVTVTATQVSCSPG